MTTRSAFNAFLLAVPTIILVPAIAIAIAAPEPAQVPAYRSYAAGSQSFEFWNALRDLGVPVQLQVYLREGYWIQQPEHVEDERRRLPDWFDRYMRP